jgi:hypothetical protein
LIKTLLPPAWKYFDPPLSVAYGTISNDSKTGYILALRYDLLPADMRNSEG